MTLNLIECCGFGGDADFAFSCAALLADACAKTAGDIAENTPAMLADCKKALRSVTLISVPLSHSCRQKIRSHWRGNYHGDSLFL